MKRVLIITYYWPPSGGAGVQRWLKFVKYLRSFNWEPIVFTIENGEFPVLDYDLNKEIPDGVEVLKVPAWEPYKMYKLFSGKNKTDGINSGFLSEKKGSSFVESLSKWIRGNLFIPDARKFWIKPANQFLNHYLQNNAIDVIISSGPPHSTHLIGLSLKNKFQIPWLSDFRDPWTNIDFYKDLKLTKIADQKHKKLENDVLVQSDIVLTIGKQLSKELKTLGAKRVEIIENGFDPQDFLDDTNHELDEKFSIAHIGSFTPSRNHLVLWKALSHLVDEQEEFKSKLEIKLIGKVDYSVLQSIKDFGLDTYLKKIEYVSHSEVIKHQKTSKLLLLMVNNTPNAKGIVTGKVFEYMASKRPILAIGPKDGDLGEILTQTSSGIVCDYDNVENLSSTIWRIFKDDTKFENNISLYSRVELTEKLVNLLNEVIS
tara:strand:- start:1275 stop:2561 length:1287 start_codon:yes stop_codon:yes gene_type:complete